MGCIMRMIFVAACVGSAVFCLCPANAQSSSDEYNKIVRQVAERESEKYTEILMTDDPDPIDLCIQAGMAARAWLDAGEARKYSGWKNVERSRCATAKIRPKR